MNTPTWFDDTPVVGALPPRKIAAILNDVGEDEFVEALEETDEEPPQVFGPGNQRRWWSLPDKPWLHMAHAFGYLAPASPETDMLPIYAPDAIHADTTLKHTRLKITLERLRVASYPGRGTHRVLLHFFAQNQIPGKAEDLHFNATYRIREGEQAAIRGYPIFVGLSIGGEGVRLRCRTINVQNEQDADFLNVLESNVFTSGLHLITTAQPALAPLSGLALGLARTIATRNQNISVQDFDLGLDFSNIPMGARLAEGAYLAVQVPESEQVVWNWDEWIYHRANGQVVKRADHRQVIPYNYLVFGVSRYSGN